MDRFSVSLWIRFLVCHPVMLSFCRHLFSFSVKVSSMDVTILNQIPFIPSWPGVFQFVIIFNLFLSESRCTLPRGCLLISFYPSIQNFCLVLIFSIFYSQIILFLLPLVADLYLCTVNQSFRRNFFVILKYPLLFIFFENSFLCQYLLIYFFLLYLQICLRLLFWGLLLFGFHYVSPSLEVSLVFAISWFVLLASFPIRILYFGSDVISGKT